jgi:hypothetical protein
MQRVLIFAFLSCFTTPTFSQIATERWACDVIRVYNNGAHIKTISRGTRFSLRGCATEHGRSCWIDEDGAQIFWGWEETDIGWFKRSVAVFGRERCGERYRYPRANQDPLPPLRTSRANAYRSTEATRAKQSGPSQVPTQGY